VEVLGAVRLGIVRLGIVIVALRLVARNELLPASYLQQVVANRGRRLDRLQAVNRRIGVDLGSVDADMPAGDQASLDAR
jgi:hypothetical protein